MIISDKSMHFSNPLIPSSTSDSNEKMIETSFINNTTTQNNNNNKIDNIIGKVANINSSINKQITEIGNKLERLPAQLCDNNSINNVLNLKIFRLNIC